MRKFPLAALALLLTSGCSSVLPLDYRHYEGADAATIQVQNHQGNVGTIYITKYDYVEAESCYQMDSRYVLDSNILEADGNIIRENIKAGGFYAVEQTLTRGAYVYSRSSPFIPEVGKHYYISPGHKALEIPATLQVTPDVSDAMMLQKYKEAAQAWPINNRCKNFVGKILS